MRVLLYFQGQKAIKKSGVGRAMKHQMQALDAVGIEYSLIDEGEFDLIHINTLLTQTQSLIRKYRKKKIPIIVHGHSTLEDFRDSFRGWKTMSLYFYPQLLSIYRQADLIITPTPYSKRIIDSYQLDTKVVYLSNGIDLNAYRSDEQKLQVFKDFFSITNEKVVIGIGYPFVRKGVLDFIEVARLNPEITFIWFGHLASILNSTEILNAIKKKPDNVILPGYISNDVIKGAMQYASCLLFPSFEETEGIVVLEAMASRLPLLVRRIGVYDEWLKEDVSCYMAASVNEFHEKLSALLSKDNSQMIEAAYQVVSDRSLEKIGIGLKEIYENLISDYKKKI
ncbi:MAG: glycosyltransferase family 4 protein [Erysipelotrichaceae bacterium]|jgi:1,2-diacylglycerol-3-alpha-glucose alpha-1,2-glucosyltransferase|nr:glycosyltransferase family 4 protein [Erysipelotrichaceae bacterium]